ncbi:MAG TPA: DUF927 domain-containing protein, partial [Phenylobacterium sp.]
MTAEGFICDYTNAQGERVTPVFLSAPFEVIGLARDAHGSGWSVVIRFWDPDGREKVQLIARGRLMSGGADVRADLADVGLEIAPGKGKAERFCGGLARVKLAARMILADRTGWSGSAFVMPHRTIGPVGAEPVHFTGESLGLLYSECGELDDWKSAIGAMAVGNELLTFALSAAFAGPLLRPLSIEGGGFHLRGPSSCGKTTLAMAAGSVWGGGGPLGYAQSWRSTSNALESVAAGHSDGLLVLDELSLLAPEEAGAAAYQLASGQAKARAQTNGAMRRRAEWRLLLLSTGETALSAHIEASRRGDKVMTGQELRLLDIDADAGKGAGVWSELYGSDAAGVSDAIKNAAGRCYGLAGPAFLNALVRDRAAALASAKDIFAGFLEHARESGDTGQAGRGAARFAIVASAGELAAAFGVVPWERGAASAAALALFQRWAAAFGRQAPREEREILVRLRNTILSEGATAFVGLKKDAASTDGESPESDGRTGEARQLKAKGFVFEHEREQFYGFHAGGWKETFAGLDQKNAAKIVAARGFLESELGRYQKDKKVSGKKLKLYWVRASIVEHDFG